MPRSVITGNQDLGTVEVDRLKGTGVVEVVNILDQDGLANDSEFALATQQSVKAYVDNNSSSVALHAVKAFLSSTNFNSSVIFAARNIFPATASLAINEGGFTSAAAGITIPAGAGGIYYCFFNIGLNSAGAREAPRIRFSINGTGQEDNSVCTYIRDSSGHQDSSAHLATIYNLSAGDVIGLQSIRATSATAAVDSSTNSNVSLIKIG